MTQKTIQQVAGPFNDLDFGFDDPAIACAFLYCLNNAILFGQMPTEDEFIEIVESYREEAQHDE